MGVELARDTPGGGRVHRILDTYKNTLTIVLIGGELEDAFSELRRDPPARAPKRHDNDEPAYPKIEIVRYPAGWPWHQDRHWMSSRAGHPYNTFVPTQLVPRWQLQESRAMHRPLVGWMVLLEPRDRSHVFPFSEGDADDLECRASRGYPRLPRHWLGPFDTFEEAKMVVDVQTAFPFWLEKAEKMRRDERFVPDFERFAYAGDPSIPPEDLLRELRNEDGEARLTLALGNPALKLFLLDDPATWKKPMEDARGRLQKLRRAW